MCFPRGLNTFGSDLESSQTELPCLPAVLKGFRGDPGGFPGGLAGFRRGAERLPGRVERLPGLADVLPEGIGGLPG